MGEDAVYQHYVRRYIMMKKPVMRMNAEELDILEEELMKYQILIIQRRLELAVR
jgi:23S rRNA maturation mini-RNase III